MNDLLGNNNFKYCKESGRSLLVILFVYGVQELLRTQFFRCPCTSYALYSFIMLTAPSVFLLGLGFCSSDGYWKFVSRHKQIVYHKLKINHCLKSLPILFEPFLPVVAFIVFAFLRGEYYACAKAGGQDAICVSEQGPDPNVRTPKTRAQDIAKYNTQSQLLACGILSGVTIFVVGIFFIRNCCFENDGIPNNEELRVMENQILSAEFREKLKKTIEGEVKRDMEEVFDGLEDRDADNMLKQARDKILKKKCFKNVRGFSRLTFHECGHASPIVTNSRF